MTSDSDIMNCEACNTSCVTLGLNNATYCDVNATWTPRKWIVESSSPQTTTVIVPTAFAAIVYGITFLLISTKFTKCYRTFLRNINNIPADTDFLGVFQRTLARFNKKVSLRFCFISFWLTAPVGYMVYDTIDVALDCFYFLKLEQKNENLIPDSIFRNFQVNNAILAFAYLGALKSVAVAILTQKCLICLEHYTEKLSTSPDLNKKLLQGCRDEVTLTFRSAIPFTTLILEDGAELVLEYFYADKYAIPGWNWLVLLNSTLMAGITTGHFLVSTKKMCDKAQDMSTDNVFYLGINAPSFFLGISKLLRVYSCWYHSYDGTIPQACLRVTDEGALVQTPFQVGCHNVIDRTILICAAFAVIGAVAMALWSVIGYLCEKDKYDWSASRRDEIIGEVPGLDQRRGNRSRDQVQMSIF